jgi:DNA helicase-2/ATP-dependent DNA helicase PcrA
MRFIADLHIHSRFSRATSRTLNPASLDLWARKKGITVLGTGDFTHPEWLAELEDRLEPCEAGLFRLRPDLEKTVSAEAPSSCPGPTRFMLSGEISCIYKKQGRTRKVHHLILMPDFQSVRRFNARLARIGNVRSDGRPILGLDSRDLLEIALEASDRSFFIPAHIWTPWFSLFGSKSGFDAMEECFEDLTGHIHALETGLSSDPPMNRLLSALDPYILVSNSDAHSPAKLGREANLFHTGLDYTHMVRAMTDGEGFLGTIEFFPEEGKYHLDGHRKCGVRLDPEETRDLDALCPVCGRPLTVGVLHRVHELADRSSPRLSKAFHSLIPLPEILSEILDCGPATKRVTGLYDRLLAELGPELAILMDIPPADLEAAGGPLLAEAIQRMRENRVIREGGFDGRYGMIRLFHAGEKGVTVGQTGLFGRAAPPGGPPAAPKPRRLRKKGGKGARKKEQVLRDPILDPLNEAQMKAVLYEGGHLLVKAGPGTGKTLTLAHRIAYLIREGRAASEQILALTFTRKAAREMARRISRLLGEETQAPRIATFHTLCLGLLREEGVRLGLPTHFTLCSEQDSERIAAQALTSAGKNPRSLGAFLRALPDLKRAAPFSPETLVTDFLAPFEAYQKRLRSLGMLDLDDLLVEALRLLKAHPDLAEAYALRYPWILVDEYQDTNAAQSALLRALADTGTPRLFAIGDPDQSIYGFRGADVKNYHRFSEDFAGAEQVVLSRNYRSTTPILKGAAALMGHARPLESTEGDGAPIALGRCTTDGEEAEMIVEQVERLIGGTSYFSLDSGRVASHQEGATLGFGDVGILFRLNAQGDALEKAFSRSGIPYVRSGEMPLIERHPVDLLWRFFRAISYPGNPLYEAAYRELTPKPVLESEIRERLNLQGPLTALIKQAIEIHPMDPAPGEPADALGRLMEIADDFEGDLHAFLDMLSLERGIDHSVLLGDRVALMSLHAAKGLQWPVVFITGCEDRLMPCTLFGSRDVEEERRLLYVGMTRARARLTLSCVMHRTLGGRPLRMKPSPFLKAIPADLCRPLVREGRVSRKKQKQLELF